MKIKAAEPQVIFEQKLRYYLFTIDKIKYRKETISELLKTYNDCEVPESLKKEIEAIK